MTDDPTARIGKAMVAITAKLGSRALQVFRTDGVWRIAVHDGGNDDVAIKNPSLAECLDRVNDNLREER